MGECGFDHRYGLPGFTTFAARWSMIDGNSAPCRSWIFDEGGVILFGYREESGALHAQSKTLACGWWADCVRELEARVGALGPPA